MEVTEPSDYEICRHGSCPGNTTILRF